MAASHEAKQLERQQFPCSQCGALLIYKPGTRYLECGYCNNQEPIPVPLADITEHDFRSALNELAQARRTPAIVGSAERIRCDACGASFEFDRDIHSGECPYCGQPIVMETGDRKIFKPQSLLPFKIGEAEARNHFKLWLKSLWFAPTGIKKYARGDNKLAGIYLPYWTYDSDTTTSYSGARGDAYQVPQKVVQVINGKRVVRTVMVTKLRWTPVRGVVSRFFDDVLIGASRSLPRQITDRLGPWDLDQLVPYQEQYLSGFGSQAYQVELDDGFDRARVVMDGTIRSDIARDIGGDAQRIHSLETRHRDTTFKHILLPIWSAGFRFKEKTFHFVVNARSGKVRGERPYSSWKIGVAVLVGIIVIGGAYYFFDRYGQYQAAQVTPDYQGGGVYRY
jgi:DNA-directed RNA polymerase subunit RPC12/RpoP